MRAALAAAILAWTVPAAARPPHLALSLIAATDEPRPGSSMLIGLRFQPEPGWHGYWSNPGDSGLAPTVSWQAPAGVTFGALQHPAPTMLAVTGLTSFVHAGEHVLLVKATVPQSTPAGAPLPITADVRWLACSATLCVPEHAAVSLDLETGRGTPGLNAAAITRAQAAVPRVMKAAASYSLVNGQLRLALPQPPSWNRARVRFYPDDNGILDAARMKLVDEGSGAAIMAPADGTPPARLTGVLSDGQQAVRLTYQPEMAVPLPNDSPTATLAPAPPPALKTMAAVRRKPVKAPPASPARHAPSSPDPQTSSWSPTAILAAAGALVLAAVLSLALLRRRKRTSLSQ